MNEETYDELNMLLREMMYETEPNEVVKINIASGEDCCAALFEEQSLDAGDYFYEYQ